MTDNHAIRINEGEQKGGLPDKCMSCEAQHLVKLGISLAKFDYVIALAGNPNTGKSTVFNNLTGLRQHTGNWPGKTVSRAEGGYEYAGKRYKLIDLPGTYSLLSNTTDEEIARDFILFGKPDAVVIVVDATRLERNLNLTLQILEITDRAVVVLNLIDEAHANGIYIDERKLAKQLGVPVIPAVARKKFGMPELIHAIKNIVENKKGHYVHKLDRLNPNLEQALNEIISELNHNYPELPNKRWIALRLLEGDESIEYAVRSGNLANTLQNN